MALKLYMGDRIQLKGSVTAREVSNECLCQKVQSPTLMFFLIIESKVHLWLKVLQLKSQSRHTRAMGREARACGRGS